ncbi:RHS repeat-associated core domain-containing protein [Pseudomonas frederiksbergensis]|uniref:RHS repeat-associated core domain-containing protein n=1 Tax=Pseudomonas frederiksbergensis TaxID=104087 RepID=UPI0011CDECB2|nr:RHS repeat-associated core domain-containing protein [Pseudomonas frederiksbergensis]
MTETRLGDTCSTFTYDDLARIKTIKTVDGAQALETGIAYDDFGREALRTFKFGQEEATQTLAQVYDEADRLINRTLKQGSDVLRDETYAYDDRGRLVDYSCEGSQCPVDPYGKTIIGQMFGFDEKDNLTFLETTFDEGHHTIDFEYNNDDPCQLSALVNTLRPERPDDPSYPPRIDFEYDANGNLLNDEAGRSLDYDSLSRLISVSALSGETANDYHYDSLDTLSGSQSDGSAEQRFYQNGELANSVRGADTSTFVRAEGIVLAEHQEGAGPKSLLLASDDKNSVLCEVSLDGRNEIAYSAYGHRGDDAAMRSHLGYNGEFREAQTGCYLLGGGYRAFNPGLMRFHSPDSLSPFGDGGLNAYMYCLGNPVSFTDPTGHISILSKLVVFFMMTGDDVTRVAGSAGSNAAKTAGRSSRQLANVTDELASVSVSARPSRPFARQSATGARSRTPTPDYDSSVPQTLARERGFYVASNSPEEASRMTFKQAKAENPALEMPVTRTSPAHKKVSAPDQHSSRPKQPKQPKTQTEQEKRDAAFLSRKRIEDIRKNDGRF